MFKTINFTINEFILELNFFINQFSGGEGHCKNFYRDNRKIFD